MWESPKKLGFASISLLFILCATSARHASITASARCLSLKADTACGFNAKTRVADGQAKIYLIGSGGKKDLILITEIIDNEVNPQWKAIGKFNYVPGSHQVLRAYVYDIDRRGKDKLGGPLDFKLDNLDTAGVLSVSFGTKCKGRACGAVGCKCQRSKLTIQVNITVEPYKPITSGPVLLRGYAKCLDPLRDGEDGLPDGELTLDLAKENGKAIETQILKSEEVSNDDNPYWKKVGRFEYKKGQEEIIIAEVRPLGYSSSGTLTPEGGLEFPVDELIMRGKLVRTFGTPCTTRCVASCVGKNSSLYVQVVQSETTHLDGDPEYVTIPIKLSGSAACLYKPVEITDKVDGELTIYVVSIDGREYGSKVLGSEEQSNNPNPVWTTTGDLYFIEGRHQILRVRVYDLDYEGATQLTNADDPLLVDAEELVAKGVITRKFGTPCEGTDCPEGCAGRQPEVTIKAAP